jgi:hypothetical protein
MDHPKESLAVSIGPLHYEFVAHDAWGLDLLARLRANLDCLPFAGQPNRVLHLMEFSFTQEEYAEISEHRLPGRLASKLPQPVPSQGWRLTGDETGLLCWYQAETRHTIGTYHSLPGVQPSPFHLPWQPILQDMIRLGGGILHGGLVQRGGHGYLFTAPPGGGKTTALSRMPAPWQVLSDDAALVWSDPAGGFRSSPLPTWSVLLVRSEAIPVIERWQVGRAVNVAGVMLLRKAQHERLSSLPPIQAAQHLYRALSEHPRVVSNRTPFRHQLFHSACCLARTVPCWELELTHAGRFWDVISDALDGA